MNDYFTLSNLDFTNLSNNSRICLYIELLKTKVLVLNSQLMSLRIVNLHVLHVHIIVFIKNEWQLEKKNKFFVANFPLLHKDRGYLIIQGFPY